MVKQLPRVIVLASAVLLASAAAALGAPLKGATYAGATVRSKASITLKVSKNGKTVTLNAPYAPLYCEGGGGGGIRRVTRPAAVSNSGSFSGSIAFESTLTHQVFARLFLSGKFSGHTVSGTARSEYPKAKQCGGSTSFTAKAK